MKTFFRFLEQVEGGAQRRLTKAGQPPTRPTARVRACRMPARNAGSGFSLIELLAVIVIISVLIGMLGGAYISARNYARRGRAETQLRELVKAWNEYYVTYGSFPYTGQQAMTTTTMAALFAAGNARAIPFLSISSRDFHVVPAQGDPCYTDPWGNPYYITFGSGQAPQEVALRIAVSFPNRNRYQ